MNQRVRSPVLNELNFEMGVLNVPAIEMAAVVFPDVKVQLRSKFDSFAKRYFYILNVLMRKYPIYKSLCSYFIYIEKNAESRIISMR